jgi:hypothetical protein
MLAIPRRYGHFVYGVVQSGLICAIASAIASFPFLAMGSFAVHWLQSWLISWLLMLPVVLIAAPFIRKLTDMAAAGPRLRLDAAPLNSYHFRRKTRYWRLRWR